MGHPDVLFLYNIERRTSGWNLVSRFIFYLHGRSLCTVIPEWNRMSYRGPVYQSCFLADDLCLMAPCAFALQELINMCFKYSIEIELNFNALKSYCVAFLPKLYKLALPVLHINSMPISYKDSIKYLGYIFSNNNNDDAEMLRQMRLLYCRSSRLVRMFSKCSKTVLIELCRSFAQRFTVPIFGHNIKKLHFRSFVLHIATYIVKY